MINPYNPSSTESEQSPYYRTSIAAARWSEILALATGPISFLNGALMKLGFSETLLMAQSDRPPIPADIDELLGPAQDALLQMGGELESLGYKTVQIARMDLLGDADGARMLLRYPGNDRIGVCLYNRCLENEASVVAILSFRDNNVIVETTNSGFSLDDGIPSETERYPERSTEWLHIRHDERLRDLAHEVARDPQDDESVVAMMDRIEESASKNLIRRGVLQPITREEERALRDMATHAVESDG